MKSHPISFFTALLVAVMFSLAASSVSAHDAHDHPARLRSWSVQHAGHALEASFLLFKDDHVFLEDAAGDVHEYAISSLSADDQVYVKKRQADIQRLNAHLDHAQEHARGPATAIIGAIIPVLLLVIAVLLVPFSLKRVRKPHVVLPAMAIFILLAGFGTHELRSSRSLTDPLRVDSAFTPFKPGGVNTFWDNDYFYVESNGIAHHEMMTGITAWQQQLPIPQCYVGANAWPIPLNPVLAETAVPVNPDHFSRGAVAVAVNGVPIFNPYTNTGVDAFLDGQLDDFGGHSGRADDYHYHIAPLHLYSQTSPTLPIAYALDGFAVYGDTEPEGGPMLPLDENHGHFASDGVYHYHGSAAAPYMIGNMVGQVTEDDTHQIIPQAHANPVRPSYTPLQGAVITDCTPNATNNGYTLVYTLGGATDSIVYNWTSGGTYTFSYYVNGGITTNTYQDFIPCTISTSMAEVTDMGSGDVTIYPVPASNSFSLRLSDDVQQQDVQAITVFDLKGKTLYSIGKYTGEIDVRSLSPGTYLVKIQLPAYTVTKKLIIH